MAGTKTTINTTTYPLALSNDGTAGAYYIEAATGGSSVVVVHLEGGGLGAYATGQGETYDILSRSAAQRGSGALPASRTWQYGILANAAGVNPHWYQACHVEIAYTSSDLWSQTGRSATVTVSGADTTYYFRGKDIVSAVFQTLIAAGTITASSTVIFSGSSAGGFGVLHNWPAVERLLLAAGVSDYFAISDAGFGLATWPRWTGDGSTYYRAIGDALNFYGTGNTPDTRFFGPNLLARMSLRARQRLFIVQGSADQRYLFEGGFQVTTRPPTAGESTFLAAWQAATEDYFTDTYEHGCFVPYYLYSTATQLRLAHNLINTSWWYSADMEVDGVRPADAIQQWVAANGGAGQRFIGTASGSGSEEPPDEGDWWTAASQLLVIRQVLDAKNAASYAASLLDLSAAGNDAATGVQPAWANGTGWTFNGSTQYINTGLTPADGETFAIRFSAILSTAGHIAGSVGDAALNVHQGATYSQTANQMTYANGGYLSTQPFITSGVVILTRGRCYVNGQKLGKFSAWNGTNPYALLIGCSNKRGTPANFAQVTVELFLLGTGGLDEQQVAALTAAMQNA